MPADSDSATYLPMGEVKSGWLSPTSPKPDPKPQERFGNYLIQSVLGRGGMATVYLASSGSLAGSRRWCALKLLRSELARDEMHVKMLFTEAQLGSELTHPNVCSVFDYGYVDGRPYLAMELLRGKSLAAVKRNYGQIANGAEHGARIARIIADASEGLEAIHLHRSASDGPLRVVHRDISPDNLILTFDGFVKIIDFGLAKAERRGERTQSGILKGKLSYIAPELLGGAAPDARADVWSLGIVAWELLTGRRLFHRATDAETLKAVVEAEIEPPSRIVHGLAEELDAVVLGALARDPAERYATAARFNERLWEFLAARGPLMQHRDIAAWLDQLFPGERERTDNLLQSALGNAEGIVDRARRRESGKTRPLLARAPQRWRIRLARTARSLRRRRARALWISAAAAAGATILIWMLAELWSSLGGSAREAYAPTPVIGVAQTTLQTSGGFVVEIERPDLSNDVIVRVRAAPTTSVPPLMPATPPPNLPATPPQPESSKREAR